MHDDSKALVSVIVPIYNTEKFLDQCLSSIEAQTYKNFEVLCINDGSTDGSRDIILAHAEKDPRIKLVDKENGGYGQGCNLGLSLAKGEWVSIIERAVEQVFDLCPGAIIRDLELRRPVFEKTAAYGHFGHESPEFT